MLFSSGEALFMEDPLPLGLATRSWLGVIRGPLSSTGMSKSPSVLPSADDISMLVGSKVHSSADPSMESRVCGLEINLASWRVSHAHFSEARVDGLLVPITTQSAFRTVLTLSASSLGLSASVVVSLPASLALALFAAELLVPHSQARSVVPDMPLIADTRLPGVGMVARTELSTCLPVPAATTPGIPGVCIPLAEAVLLLVPGVRATLPHPVPCLSIV